MQTFSQGPAAIVQGAEAARVVILKQKFLNIVGKRCRVFGIFRLPAWMGSKPFGCFFCFSRTDIVDDHMHIAGMGKFFRDLIEKKGKFSGPPHFEGALARIAGNFAKMVHEGVGTKWFCCGKIVIRLRLSENRSGRGNINVRGVENENKGAVRGIYVKAGQRKILSPEQLA